MNPKWKSCRESPFSVRIVRGSKKRSVEEEDKSELGVEREREREYCEIKEEVELFNERRKLRWCVLDPATSGLFSLSSRRVSYPADEEEIFKAGFDS